ncbi:response regulator [Alkaliphilus peptidifermentans]|uniref:Stage 0 sporulation protein A homolog n=1 Tax=Alkaliphilus peptidifermentans DSM 18978 TaxID=1120976 RepID=A0A1G5CJV8_9FIRM|nr:response regulator [Alkaliphilus peptidifermentans]SCY02819.1 Response regulator receiver domain-containing protein [Alkaliphilus peptidifermentans DSM 18978]
MKKVLIVEDEKNIILSLKMLLMKEGYKIEVATNGIDAIKLAQEALPDLIFLDIVLPYVNGYLVCEALREDPNTKHIPIIFTSAKNQEKDIQRAFEVGGSDYIVKPFTPAQIKELLIKYLKEE